MSPPNLAPQVVNLSSSQRRDITVPHTPFSGTISKLLDGLPTYFKQRNHVANCREDYVGGQGLDQFDRPRVTIESLPVDVLLDIFYLYQRGPYGYAPHRWRILVRVCRRWRYIVFAFPHRLDLFLECTAKTSVRRTLDVWPCMPIIVRDTWLWTRKWRVLYGDNIIAALERCDRVCIIDLECPTLLLGQLSRVMQVPFPALTYLKLEFADKSVPAPTLPDAFLGGSAPHLQRLILGGIPFPALPNLLSSCQDLVEVQVNRIPPAGYISPKAMVTGLSALAKLETLHIGFEPSASRPDQHPLPPTPVVLPALVRLQYRGASAYFEDLIARIDTSSIRTVTKSFD